jgi:hypothetical protein
MIQYVPGLGALILCREWDCKNGSMMMLHCRYILFVGRSRSFVFVDMLIGFRLKCLVCRDSLGIAFYDRWGCPHDEV